MKSRNNAAKVKRFFSFKRKYVTIPYLLFLILFVLIPILIIVFYAFTDTAEDGSLVISGVAFLSFFTSPTKINVLVVSSASSSATRLHSYSRIRR